MNENQVEKYQILDTFKITGKGIVFSGFILDGIISIGNFIEFSAYDKVFKRQITGVEGITSSQSVKANTGLLIKCIDKQEIEKLRDWKPENIIAFVYEQND